MKNIRRNFFAAALVAMLINLAGCATTDNNEDATAEELYAIARKSMDNRNWLTAVEDLRKVEAKFPYGSHAEQAQLDTIYAHYRAEDTGLAISAADRFIKLHPTHRAVDYAYYLKGLANYQENNSLFGRLTGRDDLSDRDANLTRDALDAFTDVYTLFPESEYADDARERAAYLYNALARHELAVSAFYFSRNACVAVVNRAKGVIENYETAPAMEEALALLLYCYQQMGLADLSEDAKRELSRSFPNSEYLAANGRKVLVNNLKTPGVSIGERDDGLLLPLLGRFGGE